MSQQIRHGQPASTAECMPKPDDTEIMFTAMKEFAVTDAGAMPLKARYNAITTNKTTTAAMMITIMNQRLMIISVTSWNPLDSSRPYTWLHSTSQCTNSLRLSFSRGPCTCRAGGLPMPRNDARGCAIRAGLGFRGIRRGRRRPCKQIARPA